MHELPGGGPALEGAVWVAVGEGLWPPQHRKGAPDHSLLLAPHPRGGGRGCDRLQEAVEGRPLLVLVRGEHTVVVVVVGQQAVAAAAVFPAE